MLDKISCSIAVIVATHNAFVKKLEIVEKAIRTMQKDLTWVSEDLGVVHEVMENMVEHVSSQVKIMTEVDILGEKRSIEVCVGHMEE